MNITLLTEIGTAGALTRVHDAAIPPFKVDPEVIVWGARVFKRSGVRQVNGVGPLVEYIEVFAHHLAP